MTTSDVSGIRTPVISTNNKFKMTTISPDPQLITIPLDDDYASCSDNLKSGGTQSQLQANRKDNINLMSGNKDSQYTTTGRRTTTNNLGLGFTPVTTVGDQ